MSYLVILLWFAVSWFMGRAFFTRLGMARNAGAVTDAQWWLFFTVYASCITIIGFAVGVAAGTFL